MPDISVTGVVEVDMVRIGLKTMIVVMVVRSVAAGRVRMGMLRGILFTTRHQRNRLPEITVAGNGQRTTTLPNCRGLLIGQGCQRQGYAVKSDYALSV